MAGATPSTADQVNVLIGAHLQQFINVKDTIQHDEANLAGLSLQGAPYNMTATDETNIKTAINNLNTALQAIDMTFINRLSGLF